MQSTLSASFRASLVRRELMQRSSVQAARSYKTIAQAGASADKAAATGSASSSAAATSVAVRELYKPPPAVQALITPSAPRCVPYPIHLTYSLPVYDSPENDLYLPAELKKLLMDYIASASLTHPRDAKFVRPDAALSAALLKKGEVLDVLTKDDALKRLKDSCVRFFEVRRWAEEAVVKCVSALLCGGIELMRWEQEGRTADGEDRDQDGREAHGHAHFGPRAVGALHRRRARGGLAPPRRVFHCGCVIFSYAS